ncbi:MAG: hypothetical protein AABX77_03345, partial [Nanoarchaeota archaeon]
MNKSALFLFFFVNILFFISIVLASDIAYIVDEPLNLEPNERAVEEILNENGHNLRIWDNDLPNGENTILEIFNADDYDIVIVSYTVDDIQNIFDNRYHKTLFLSNDAAKESGLTSSLGRTSGITVSVRRIESITNEFPLGDLRIYSTRGDIEYLAGCLPIGGMNLVSRSLSRTVLLALDKGSLLLEDGRCTQRRVEIFKRNIYFG